MLPIISAYSAPSTTNILNGQIINDTDIKGLVESSNGVNARLTQLSNNVKRELTVADTGATLNANQDVQVFANCTGGAISITLPPLSTQYKPIYFQKFSDVSYNGFTVTCAGSDKIQDLTSPAATLTATSFTIKSPDQYFVLTPTSAGWMITDYSLPSVSFEANLTTGGVSATNTESTLYYNNEVSDIGGYYNNATSGSGGRHTPLVKGKYNYFATAYFASGTSSELILILYKNATPVHQTSFTDTGNAIISVHAPNLAMNGTTDYVEVKVRSAITTKTILNLDYVTHFKGSFARYY